MPRVPFNSCLFALTAALGIVTSTPLGAAEFEFSAIIRAGSPSNSDWELGIGPAGNNSAVKGQVNTPNYYPNGLPNRFELGYTSGTNTAFLRYYYGPSSFQEVTYAPGGKATGPGSVWTIPSGSLFVAAASKTVPTSVTISELTLEGGVDVVQPFSITTLPAAQLGFSSLVSLDQPVLFRTGASGDWLLSGKIAFAGLLPFVSNGASGMQLRMGASFSGADVPEPAAAGLTLAGLAFLALTQALRRSKA